MSKSDADTDDRKDRPIAKSLISNGTIRQSPEGPVEDPDPCYPDTQGNGSVSVQEPVQPGPSRLDPGELS